MNLSKGKINFPSIFISVLSDRGGEVLGLVHMCGVLLLCIYNLLPGFWVCSAFKFCTKLTAWYTGLQIDLNFIILNGESALCPSGQGSQWHPGL